LRYSKKVKVGDDPSAIFGKAVHKVNELFWPEYSRLQDPTAALQESIKDNCPVLPSEYEEPAHICFNNFIKTVEANPKLIPLFTEIKLKNPKNDTLAVADVVYPHKIVDYKTSTQYTVKPKLNNIIQAGICAINLKECMNIDVPYVEFQYLRFNKYQTVDITPQLVETVTQIIDNVRNNILLDKFDKSKKSCFMCNYKLICQKEDDYLGKRI